MARPRWPGKDTVARSSRATIGDSVTPSTRTTFSVHTGVANRLALAALDAVKEKAFVPTLTGGKVRPDEVKTWNGEFGSVLRTDAIELSQFNLLHPSVRHCNELLQRLNAHEISTSEFFSALCHCNNDTLHHCLEAASVLFREGLPRTQFAPKYNLSNWFYNIPCWWTDRNAPRSLKGAPVLFERPEEWPEIIPADARSPEMRQFLTEIDNVIANKPDNKRSSVIGSTDSTWTEHVAKQFLRSKSDFFRRALLPAMASLDRAEWDSNGWTILRWYRKWSDRRQFVDTLPLPILQESELKGADAFRRRISRCLRFPTDKGWYLAEQCYADHTFDSPKSFGPYFKNILDRAVVCPLKDWPNVVGNVEDLELWKGLLRFAGVSWEPKIAQVDYFLQNSDVEMGYKNSHLFI